MIKVFEMLKKITVSDRNWLNSLQN